MDRLAEAHAWGLMSFLPLAPSVDALAGERDVRSTDRSTPTFARITDTPDARHTDEAVASRAVQPVLLFDLGALSFGENGAADDEPAR